MNKIEAQHFLATANGDLEKAVQFVLSHLESSEDHLPKPRKGNPVSLTNLTRCPKVRPELIWILVKMRTRSFQSI